MADRNAIPQTGGGSTEGGGVTTGIMLVLATMLIFASQDAITKIIAGTLAIPQIVMVRYWIFAIFATILISRRPGGLKAAIRARRPWLQVLRGLIMALEVGVFAFAVLHMQLSAAQALFASCPLIITALSPLVLGETVGLRRWIAIAFGFAGVLLIVRPDEGLVDPVAIVALIGATMFATYNLLTRLLSREDSFETSYGYVAWIGAIAATLVGPFLWQWPTPVEWLWLIVLACTSITGHMLLMKALELAPASLLQPFTYTQLCWGIAIGIVVFGEYPDIWMLCGAAIIVAGGLLAMRGD